MKRNFGLDLARAIAISLVLFNHLPPIFKVNGIWYSANLGVDIFFALSGFLIGKMLLEMSDFKSGILSFSQTMSFEVRRIFRTAPLYFFLLWINFLVGKYIFHSIDGIPWSYFIWMQSFNRGIVFFGESWSLCIEEWFYFSFSLGLCLFTTLLRKVKYPFKFKLIIFTLLYISVFTVIRWRFSTNISDTFIITIFRLDAIAYGVLMAIISNAFILKIIKKSLLFFGLLFFSAGVPFLVFWKLHEKFYYFYYTFCGLGIAICVFSIKGYSDQLEKIFPSKIITFISKISYSIYLNNLVIVGLVNHYFKAYLGVVPLFIASLVFIILFSWLTYSLIELPFLRFRDRKFEMTRLTVFSK
jgi:peptidoglycan/LPS O-acetylase OafA/YrhL